jgi:hypothetical protein
MLSEVPGVGSSRSATCWLDVAEKMNIAAAAAAAATACDIVCEHLGCIVACSVWGKVITVHQVAWRPHCVTGAFT